MTSATWPVKETAGSCAAGAERYRSTRRERVRGRRRGRGSLEDVASIDLPKRKTKCQRGGRKAWKVLYDTCKRPSIRDFVLYGTPFLALALGLGSLASCLLC